MWYRQLLRAIYRMHKKLNFLHQSENQMTLEEVYRLFPSISLDHGILEKADNVVVVPVEMGWNDVGS
jgi:mannose-1-phosphate guanylyltransferase